MKRVKGERPVLELFGHGKDWEAGQLSDCQFPAQTLQLVPGPELGGE